MSRPCCVSSIQPVIKVSSPKSALWQVAGGLPWESLFSISQQDGLSRALITVCTRVDTDTAVSDLPSGRGNAHFPLRGETDVKLRRRDQGYGK